MMAGTLAQVIEPAKDEAGVRTEIPSDIQALLNGRSRFRTCDPCRVKAVLYR